MKPIILILFIFFCVSIYSQTEKAETQSLSNRYNQGDFSQQEYIELAKRWNKLLDDFGGYPNLPYHESNNQVTFVEVFDLNGISKKIIFDRLMEWGAISFGSINDILKYSNFENGKLILKGNVEIPHREDHIGFWGQRKERIDSRTMYFTIVFTIKDSHLKVEILGVSYEFQGIDTTPPEYTIVNYRKSLHSLYPVTDGESIEWKARLSLIEETNKHFVLTSASSAVYIMKYKSDYEF